MAPFRPLSALTLLIVGVTINGSSQIQPFNPDSTLLTIVHQLRGTPITLEEAITQSLGTSPSVLGAGAALASARGIVRRESGTFDPELALQWNYTDQKLPSASFFAGASVLRTIEGTGSAGLKWALPTGTSLEASLSAVRLTSNSSFAFLNPQYTTVAGITLRQPLLRGFHTSARKSLTSAEQDFDAAQARYDQEVLALAAQVEGLYWDLYAGERDFAVQKLTRDRAAAFLKDTESRAHAGLIGPNQVANARTFLAEQEILLLDREEMLEAISDRFAATIGRRPQSGDARFKTAGQPRDTFPATETDLLVREAIDRNLGLRAAKADVESRRTMARAGTWEALPRIDFVGGVGGNGLAGEGRDVIFGSDTLRTVVGGGFSDAVKQAVRRTYPSWHVGLEVSIPIGLRNGLGEEDRLEAEVVMAEQRYEQELRLLEADVRAGCREVMHGRQRLSAARTGVEAAQEQVRIGLIEFQNGRTTAFELVRLGADFALAQQRYSQALVRGAKAAALLRLLTSGAYPPPDAPAQP